jgi:hypothetical protein
LFLHRYAGGVPLPEDMKPELERVILRVGATIYG